MNNETEIDYVTGRIVCQRNDGKWCLHFGGGAFHYVETEEMDRPEAGTMVARGYQNNEPISKWRKLATLTPKS
jgi:hypothetical protein